HTRCAEYSCGGTTYYCTSTGGVWQWRTNPSCDDNDPCTAGTTCGTGSCGGGTDCAGQACTGGNCDDGTKECIAGVGCVDCVAIGDCAGGYWCSSNTCTQCNTDDHCGATCADCASSGDQCNTAGTGCVDCVDDGDCTDQWCNNGTCSDCNVNAHCGPACLDCTTTSDVCKTDATGCVDCNVDGDCASGYWCSSNTCAQCNTDTHCGADCDDCTTMSPPGYDVCEGFDYLTYTGNGTCNVDYCELAADSTNCPNGCTVNTSGDGECLTTASACGAAISAMYASMGANSEWSWSLGNEGWDLDGYSRWSRYTNQGHGAGDSESAGLRNYDNNWNERTLFYNAYDLSACSSCTLSVDFWVDGEAESGYDYMSMDCSGNGGSGWTEGTRIDGTQSWAPHTQAINGSCVTASFMLSMHFYSDVSETRDGYYVDDVQLNAGSGTGYGAFDSVNATIASGWACHSSDFSDALEIHLYFYKNQAGTPEERVITAGNTREQAVGDICGGNRDHGWTLNLDPELKSWLGTGTHRVHAFATPPGVCGGGYYELPGSSKTFSL
ncbi:MAG: hypothetical protein JRI55_36840, partial [Deltaproteobacteria bacterium]|nr:hypothetical protein [Deltaproteobacteria bacterium]